MKADGGFILTFHLNVELPQLVLQLTLQHTHVLQRTVSKEFIHFFIDRMTKRDFYRSKLLDCCLKMSPVCYILLLFNLFPYYSFMQWPYSFPLS